MVVLLVLRELWAAITGSHVGSPIDFGANFGKFSLRRKMDDHFPHGGKEIHCFCCCFVSKPGNAVNRYHNSIINIEYIGQNFWASKPTSSRHHHLLVKISNNKFDKMLN